MSVTTVQPFLIYLLLDGCAVDVSSESSCHCSAGSGNGCKIPVTLGISTVVQFGSKFFNFGLAYVHCAERPDRTTKTEARFNATYVWR